MTVEEMLDRMSAREFAAWVVFDRQVEPIGDRRADLRAGGIAATIANVFRDEKKKREPFTPEECALTFRDLDEQRAETTANNAAKMKMLASLFRKKDAE
jgi:hypothetical protein